jgi:hypothetical protein
MAAIYDWRTDELVPDIGPVTTEALEEDAAAADAPSEDEGTADENEDTSEEGDEESGQAADTQ